MVLTKWFRPGRRFGLPPLQSLSGVSSRILSHAVKQPNQIHPPGRYVRTQSAIASRWLLRVTCGCGPRLTPQFPHLAGHFTDLDESRLMSVAGYSLAGAQDKTEKNRYGTMTKISAAKGHRHCRDRRVYGRPPRPSIERSERSGSDPLDDHRSTSSAANLRAPVS